MPLVLAGATSGSTTIQATDAVTQTITLPNNTGTVLTTASTFAGTGPAFSAYQSSATSLTNNAYTKILFDTEEYDTNNNFASSRFTPTVAGYYQLSMQASFASFLTTETVLAVYKNGSLYMYLQDIIASRLYGFSASTLVYANGSTDYFEFFVYQSSGTAVNTATTRSQTSFSGAMVRSA